MREQKTTVKKFAIKKFYEMVEVFWELQNSNNVNEN